MTLNPLLPIALVTPLDWARVSPRHGGVSRQAYVDAAREILRIIRLAAPKRPAIFLNRAFGCLPGNPNSLLDAQYVSGICTQPTFQNPDVPQPATPVLVSPLPPGHADTILDYEPGESPSQLFKQYLEPLVQQNKADFIVYISPPPRTHPRSIAAFNRWLGPLTKSIYKHIGLDTSTPLDPPYLDDLLDYLTSRKKKFVYGEPHGYPTYRFSRDQRFAGVITNHERCELMAGGDPQFVRHPALNFSIYDGSTTVEWSPNSPRATFQQRWARYKKLCPSKFIGILEFGDATDEEVYSAYHSIPVLSTNADTAAMS